MGKKNDLENPFNIEEFYWYMDVTKGINIAVSEKICRQVNIMKYRERLVGSYKGH